MLYKCVCSRIVSTNKSLKHVFIHKRFRNSGNHWALLERKKTGCNLALEHFDDFYKNVFDEKWASMRVALLSPNKYCAVVNNYSDTDRITSFLESLGGVNIRTLLEVEAAKQKQNKRERRREKELENVFKLDEKLERISEGKTRKDLEDLYPQDAVPRVAKIGDRIITQDSIRSDDEGRYIAEGSDLSALQEFVPATELKGREDWVPESTHYSYYSANRSEFPVSTRRETELSFPSQLQTYTFEMGNISQFPSARKGTTHVSDYYIMDGGSLLPVLALDLMPGDVVLDMCAAPGGKSFLALQTLYPKRLVCNDVSESRANRVRRVMKEFLYDFEKKTRNEDILITHFDARLIQDSNIYDKILVDVPCTTDRHSVNEPDNNIFKKTRVKERIKMPELQAEILTNALRLVKPGGIVVYSTCSLSPIQNDGVVHMALKRIWQETDHIISVVDMKRALKGADLIYKLGNDLGLRYGHMVLPYLPANFGPTYFCKLVKDK